MDLNGFDPNSVEPREAFDLLPSGWYHAVIVDSEAKPTKAGDGQYLSLEFELIDEGEFKNRKVWENLNLQNPNEKTMEIAYRDLSAICKSLGIAHVVHRSEELHDKPIMIKVGIKRQEGYEDRNVVKGYKAATIVGYGSTQQAGPATTQPQPQQQPAAPAQQQQQQPAKTAATGARPWER